MVNVECPTNRTIGAKTQYSQAITCLGLVHHIYVKPSYNTKPTNNKQRTQTKLNTKKLNPSTGAFMPSGQETIRPILQLTGPTMALQPCVPAYSVPTLLRCSTNFSFTLLNVTAYITIMTSTLSCHDPQTQTHMYTSVKFNEYAH